MPFRVDGLGEVARGVIKGLPHGLAVRGIGGRTHDRSGGFRHAPGGIALVGPGIAERIDHTGKPCCRIVLIDGDGFAG